MSPSLASAAASLRSRVQGDVLTVGAKGFDAASEAWDLSARSSAVLVLVAASIEDIAAGARWADDHDLGVALLNTGHGAFSNDGSLLIATHQLKSVAVNADARRATVEPGARWAEVSAAASPLGLVGASGSSAGVGVTGYTLGGGLGPLGRTLGFAAERVTSLTVLDEHYRPLRLDAQDGELFWGLRGGGALGIVTQLEFELDSIPAFFGGGIYFDGADGEAILTAYAAWARGLDERTTTSIALIHLPPAPQLPPALRGRFVVHVRFAHVDPEATDLVADSERLLKPLLAAARAIVDGTHLMTPEEVLDIHHDPVQAQDVAYRGGFIDDLDAATISSVVESMPSGTTPPVRMIELRHLGGAYTRATHAPSSSTGRFHSFNLYVTAASRPTTALQARSLVDGTVERITQSARGQLNFYGPAPTPGSLLELWDARDAARLVAVAIALDPRGRIRTGRPLR